MREIFPEVAAGLKEIWDSENGGIEEGLNKVKPLAVAGGRERWAQKPQKKFKTAFTMTWV